MQDWQMFVEKPKVVRAFQTPKEGPPKGISAGDEVPGLIHYAPGDWIVEFEDGARKAISDKTFCEAYGCPEPESGEETDVETLQGEIVMLKDTLASAGKEIGDLKAVVAEFDAAGEDTPEPEPTDETEPEEAP